MEESGDGAPWWCVCPDSGLRGVPPPPIYPVRPSVRPSPDGNPSHFSLLDKNWVVGSFDCVEASGDNEAQRGASFIFSGFTGVHCDFMRVKRGYRWGAVMRDR